MTKRHLLMLAALAFSTAWADDNNSFYFTDAALMPGETTNIELCMRNNATDLTCLEAEIQLPEGLSFVPDEDGNPLCVLIRTRSTQHEILSGFLSNGNLKLLVSSFDGSLFTPGEGPILCFRVQADEMASTGEYAVETVGESLLVSNTADAFYSVGITGNVLITDDPTGINDELRMKDEETDAIYNLAGQRVGKARGGIFIKNGKKELHR